MTAAHPHPRPFGALSRARFDPRMVVVGLALLAAGTVSGYAFAGVAVDRGDEVAVPVAALCQDGGPAGAQLADSGACEAADRTGVGPFVSEVGQTGAAGAAGSDGDDGTDGANGTNGADGVNGQPGTPGAPGTNGAAGTAGVNGKNGTNGVDGVSPACLAEPTQCRGSDGATGATGSPGKDGRPGRDGQDGATGPPGPTCPPGTSLQQVTFASGQEGLGCVKPAQSEEGMP